MKTQSHSSFRVALLISIHLIGGCDFRREPIGPSPSEQIFSYSLSRARKEGGSFQIYDVCLNDEQWKEVERLSNLSKFSMEADCQVTTSRIEKLNHLSELWLMGVEFADDSSSGNPNGSLADVTFDYCKIDRGVGQWIAKLPKLKRLKIRFQEQMSVMEKNAVLGELSKLTQLEFLAVDGLSANEFAPLKAKVPQVEYGQW